jgi:hypothetical protein
LEGASGRSGTRRFTLCPLVTRDSIRIVVVTRDSEIKTKNKIYNLATDLGENTDQHPDILKKLISAYDKFAQDVGVVIPTSEPFGTLFPPITANDTQTINLAKMFVLGYPLNETKSGSVPPAA